MYVFLNIFNLEALTIPKSANDQLLGNLILFFIYLGILSLIVLLVAFAHVPYAFLSDYFFPTLLQIVL